MADFWHNKKVMVTGCCGTVGSEMIRQLSQKPVKELIGIDNNESELFFIDQIYLKDSRVNFSLCDIKNRDQLSWLMDGIHIVLHAAARKHVIINEISPTEAIYTNIVGTQNVIDAARERSIQRVLFTSSDKAVNPTNVMGTSKLMGERLMTAANASRRDEHPIFSSTRFGNVLGSSGSVIPIFRRQIEEGKNITLTDPRMTRFVMTVEEAAQLVLQSVSLAIGGEVFVTKMPIIRIVDLANALIEINKRQGGNYSGKIEIIGAKPGEKLYEELINEEEIRRTVEIDDFFSILPAFKGLYNSFDYSYKEGQKKVDHIYRSDQETPMSLEELQSYLIDKKLV